MKKIYLIAIIWLFLFGCSTKMPKEVYIPIKINNFSQPIPAKPTLPIHNLNKKSKPNEVIKAYVASIELLQGYSDQLIIELKAC